MRFSGANELMGIMSGDFDGHAHVFQAGLPLVPDRRYTPDYTASQKTYLRLLQQNGLDGGLLVQPSFLGTDNAFLLSALAAARQQDGPALRGVVVLDPDDETITADEIAELSAQGIVGLRLNIVGRADTGLFDELRWKPLLKLVDQAGWHVELQCEGLRLAPVLTSLLKHCSHVVIDHFGLPDSNASLTCPGLAAILATDSNRIFVKASAPYRVFPDRPVLQATEAIVPVLHRLLDHLGPERLLWGSDWPWTRFEGRHNYSDTVAWRDSWLAACQSGRLPGT